MERIIGSYPTVCQKVYKFPSKGIYLSLKRYIRLNWNLYTYYNESIELPIRTYQVEFLPEPRLGNHSGKCGAVTPV